jgi:hypothetical protein
MLEPAPISVAPARKWIKYLKAVVGFLAPLLVNIIQILTQILNERFMKQIVCDFDQKKYRVLWDDGHTTVVFLSALYHDQKETKPLPNQVGGSKSSESEDEAAGKAHEEINNVDAKEGSEENCTAVGTANKRRRVRVIQRQQSSKAPSIDNPRQKSSKK